MFLKLKNCHNIKDFRKLAKQRIPSPLFHYIDGGSDDEFTLNRNTEAFNKCSLIPNVLAGIKKVDLSCTLFGTKMDMPFFFSPTAMQRLFHHDGEKAVARVADREGLMVGVSTIGTVSIEELANITKCPKIFQLYIHKDKALTYDLINRVKAANYNAIALTVDTVVGGNRERDLYTGMTTPPKLTLKSLLSFAAHPEWTLNYIFRKKFELAQVKDYIKQGSDITSSIVDYINDQMEPSVSWDDAKDAIKKWDGPFALKGIASVEDAKKAVDIGATAIMISNHGGRQLDGSVSPFDILPEIVDAVGDKLEIILDGGIRRGTHILKALSLGAKACSGGRIYLYALAGGGEKGVQRIVTKLKEELNRDMMLMGCDSIKKLNKKNIKFI
ncbi:MAG: alpha-hydroxy-acid oxidizing enzyme [Pelagibacteraceae bacterium]|nr:alpha-hydroxy-acid oxidizing enzyme [Pelagibacteraceae bacterium]